MSMWLTWIGPPDLDRDVAFRGAVVGLFIGAITGSLLGTMALVRDIRAGRYDRRAEELGMTMVFLAFGLFFGAYCLFGLVIYSRAE
jgi:hypothetical protein